ncbi:MAG: carboxymuconolactone decarboxylase family protein [Vicinamibacterales bacterium]|nr:carboxymuconolactone decarboxylase family protein [Vicinamibacterales bacterium]
MPFIEMVEPESARGLLAELYTQIAKARGGVADIHKVQSLNPRAMAAHLDLYKAIMFQPGPLSRQWREAIAVAVSRANSCAYCVAHHQAALDGLEAAEVPPGLLTWAARMTTHPGGAAPDDVAELRTLGLSDRAILDAILVVGYFNYVNRLVLATGLAVEPDFEKTCRPTLGTDDPGDGGGA